MVDQTPQRQNSDSGNSINSLSEAIAGTVSQKRPQTSSALFKPLKADTLMFDGKNEKLELFKDLFQTMLRMQPEMSEAMKNHRFHSHLREEAVQKFKNTTASNKRTLEDIIIIFKRKYVRPQSQTTAKHKCHKLILVLARHHSQHSSRN